ncbi:hypothetical protein FHS27_001033 [Rhodopirellula rubra]|uniref:Uncharacterized protein n=1 Tax=Aporhodopirellula rubra TaxID=980271 RepID=A0A7W5DVE3_9BACT|nr:hypothetical protein [Aporhodopirellula rubra]
MITVFNYFPQFVARIQRQYIQCLHRLRVSTLTQGDNPAPHNALPEASRELQYNKRNQRVDANPISFLILLKTPPQIPTPPPRPPATKNATRHATPATCLASSL